MGKRSYNEACGIARALDLVGERWTLMVVRELLLGPKRFSDIRHSLPGLSPDVLSQRLRDLEQAELVVHRRLPPPAPAQVYELTPRGRALEDVLIALGRWGGANCAPPAEGVGMSLDSHLMSLRTLFEPELAGDLQVSVALRLGEHSFRAEVAGGAIEVERGEPAAPDVEVVTEARVLLELVRGWRELDDALATGDLRLTGDRERFERFLTLFPLPAAA